MNASAFVKATLPVIVGVIVAGYLLNTFRTNDLVNQAISGFDA